MRHFEFSLANNFQPMAFLCGMGHIFTDASHSKEDDDDDADGAVVMITYHILASMYTCTDWSNSERILFKENCRLCTRLVRLV